MRKLVLVLLFAYVPMYGQELSDEDAVLRVLGLMQIEDAREDEMERLIELRRHPVKLNSAGRRGLESTGLFTPFQIASLLDYMERHGDIMSLAELSNVDGFTSQITEGLYPFILFDSGSLARKSAQTFNGELSVRSSLKYREGEKEQWVNAVKGKASFRETVGLSFSAFSHSASLSWNYGPGVLVIGDYNARFGQGLCLWNTVTIGGLLAPSSFMRRASGIAPSYSFSGTYAMTGVAGNLSVGDWMFSGLLNFPNLKKSDYTNICPAFNATRYFRFGHAGFTCHAGFSDVDSKYFRIPQMRMSADASFCFKGVNVFGEAQYDLVNSAPAAVAGVESPAGEYMTVASMVRFLPLSDEHGLAASMEAKMKHHLLLVAADAVYHPSGKSLSEGRAIQLKGQAKWRWDMSDWFSTEVRLTERFRTWGTACRTDARIDLLADVGMFQFVSRFNVLICKETGWLGYIEGQYKPDARLKIYLRQGIFRINNWDDRIYVYERDAPGNFNVPAYYGRGIWTSGYVSWKFTWWGSLYLRSSYIVYPMMREKKKPGKAELKLQCVLHF